MIFLILLFKEIEQYVIDKENLSSWHDEIFYQKRFRRGLTSSALSGSYRISNFFSLRTQVSGEWENCSIFSNLYF